MRNYLAGLILCLFATAAQAQSHPCEADAMKRAAALLKLHWNDDGLVLNEAPGEPSDAESGQSWMLDDAASLAEPLDAPAGDAKLDVLEINGYVYKATYRMRFIYAQIPETCALFGQEILELASP
jgi:hypothetical protein